MSADDEDQRPGIQSVEIGAEILGALASSGRPIPLKDLAMRCGYSAGKVHRYLVSLTRANLVEQNAETGYYGVGRSAIAIGLSGLWAASPTREAARALTQLRDASSETAFAAIWTDMGPVVSLLEECERPIYMNIRVGAVLSMNASASGRVFQAWLNPAEVSKAVRLQERMLAPESLKFNAQEMKRVVTETREKGFAAVSSLTVAGVNALAAPVFDYRGKIAAVIGLLGRVGDLHTEEGSKHVSLLLEASTAASERTGYRVHPASD